MAWTNLTKTGDYTNGKVIGTATGQQNLNTEITNIVSKINTAGALADGAYPWHVPVDVFMGASANTNFSTISTGANIIHGGYISNGGVQNSEVTFNVVLNAGTWTMNMMHGRNTTHGIATVYLDGSSIGTVDAYGSISNNNVSAISSIAVSTSGKHVLRIVIATKNASSSSYFFLLQGITFVRTA